LSRHAARESPGLRPASQSRVRGEFRDGESAANSIETLNEYRRFEGLELTATDADSRHRVRQHAATVGGNLGVALLRGIASSAALWYLILFAVFKLA
jgi:hypothetical protein